MGAIAALPGGDSASLDWRMPYPQLGEPASSRRHAHRPALYPDWYWPVHSRIVELVRLRDDWDGRGARSIKQRDLVDALAFMSSVMRFDTVAPWIGPLSSGGVQLTWRMGDLEVEAVFDSARHERELIVVVGENEWDAPVERGASLFAQVVDRLSAEPPVLT
jgi:hypothetical protein